MEKNDNKYKNLWKGENWSPSTQQETIMDQSVENNK